MKPGEKINLFQEENVKENSFKDYILIDVITMLNPENMQIRNSFKT